MKGISSIPSWNRMFHVTLIDRGRPSLTGADSTVRATAITEPWPINRSIAFQTSAGWLNVEIPISYPSPDCKTSYTGRRSSVRTSWATACADSKGTRMNGSSGRLIHSSGSCSREMTASQSGPSGYHKR